MGDILVDSEGGSTDSSGAYRIDLGDCYTGNIRRKDVWITNRSRGTLLLKVASASPDELLFDSDGRSENYDRILSIVSSNSHNSSSNSSSSSTSSGGRKTSRAGVTKDSENPPSINSSSSNGSMAAAAQQGRSRGDTLLGYAPFKTNVIADSWAGNRAKRCSSRIVDAFTISSLTLRDDFDDNTGFSDLFRTQVGVREGALSPAVQRAWERADILALSSGSPGGSIPSGQASPRAKYNPFDSGNATMQCFDYSKRRLSSVYALEPLAIKQGERKHLTLLFCPAAAAGGADGTLVSRSVRATLSWTTLSSRKSSDMLSDLKRLSLKQMSPAACSRSLVCEARTCTSIITVSPRVVDLGECNVGEYRRATFCVTNESDLPARVVPAVESETLGIMDQEVVIPPRATAAVNLEYVARLENADYSRDASFVNMFSNSPNGNLTVTVRAKNVDTQQVLLHSLFYRIDTHNRRRHLQVLFEKCLYGMPNFKYFTIRNVHSEDLRIRLCSPSPDIKLFALDYGPVEGPPQDAGGHRRASEPAQGDLEQMLGQYIEELKWGGRSVYHHDVNRRVSSDDMYTFQSINSNRRALSDDKSDSSLVDPPLKLERSPSRQRYVESCSPSLESLYESQLDTIHRLGYVQCLALMSKVHFPFCALHCPERLASLRDYTEQEPRPVASPLKAPDPSCMSPPSPSGSDRLEEQEQEGVKIRLIQKCFKKLAMTMVREDVFHPVTNGTGEGDITIKVGQAVDIAVVFEPSSEGQEQELELTNYLKLLQLRLLSVDSEDAEQLRKDKGVSGVASSAIREPLKPRQLVLRAKLFRSEMRLQEWSINFGRMEVGETSTRSATLVNRSDVPCIYSIAKSGSISSGFLRISSDHKGYIGPKSSRTIDFIFKPILSGVFDEVVQIRNVLDSRNVQTIAVKAKVTKPESFQLLPVCRGALRPQESGMSQEFLERYPPPSLMRVGSHGSASSAITGGGASNADKIARLVQDALVADAQRAPIAAVNFGDALLGEPCSRLVSFKLRNVTAKSRSFVVDASHSHALGLAGVAGGGAAGGGRARSNSESELSDASPEVPFQGTPDAVPSMLSLRCRFEKMSESAPRSDSPEASDDRVKLEDRLEHFQQKLKIAQHKNKADKIAKYEKKVRETKELLLGAGDAADPQTATGESDMETDTEGGEGEAGRRGEAGIEVVPAVPAPDRVVGDSCSSFSFTLGPGAEAAVHATLTVVPGARYSHWEGPLPLRGCLRVYEGKNEDVVKYIFFGGSLYAPSGADV